MRCPAHGASAFGAALRYFPSRQRSWSTHPAPVIFDGNGYLEVLFRAVSQKPVRVTISAPSRRSGDNAMLKAEMAP